MIDNPANSHALADLAQRLTSQEKVQLIELVNANAPFSLYPVKWQEFLTKSGFKSVESDPMGKSAKEAEANLLKYSPDQERDDHGRFSSEGGSGAREPQTMPYPMRIGDNANWLTPKGAEAVGTAFKNASLDPIKIRMTTESLAKLVNDGRMKSVFETGKNFANNPGASYISNRNNLEKNIWKVPDDATRPIYGYLDTNYDNHIPRVEIYGDTEITLKDDVANRTTMTAGDSLNNYTVPVQVTDAQEGNLSAKALSNATERASVMGGHVFVAYYEAQIHGGVSLSDIKSVNLFGKTIDKSFYDSLIATGIEVKNAHPSQ